MQSGDRRSDFQKICGSQAAALVWALATSGCYSGPPGAAAPAWDPGADGTSGGEEAESAEGDGAADSTAEGEGEDPGSGSTGGEEGCEPLASRVCTCDGVDGEQWCLPDGSGYSGCQCDQPDGGSTGGDEPPAEPPPANDDEVCFPGENGDGTTCLPLYRPPAAPSGYGYPGAYQGNPNYREPVAFIDLDAVDLDTYVSPNFRLGEIAERFKGQYAIVQPHAVESLQALRDAVGAIGVNSGYRSPDYNSQIGGATYSRHMYGDGFDLNPIDVGLTVLEGACSDAGGMLVEYDSHVHCDFRFDDVDPEFFGPAAQAIESSEPQWTAQLVEEQGVFVAPAFGFDEGTPKRRWVARDGDGEVLANGIGPIFVPPPGTARVEVEVGRQVWLGTDV